MNTRRAVLAGVGATLVAGVIPALAIAWTPQRWEGRDYMQCMCTPGNGGGMWAAYPVKDDTPEKRAQTEDFLRRGVSR